MKALLMEKIMKSNDNMVIKVVERTLQVHENCSILNIAKYDDTIKIYIKYKEGRHGHVTIMNEFKIDSYTGFDDVHFQRCIVNYKLK